LSNSIDLAITGWIDDYDLEDLANYVLSDDSPHLSTETCVKPKQFRAGVVVVRARVLIISDHSSYECTRVYAMQLPSARQWHWALLPMARR